MTAKPWETETLGGAPETGAPAPADAKPWETETLGEVGPFGADQPARLRSVENRDRLGVTDPDDGRTVADVVADARRQPPEPTTLTEAAAAQFMAPDPEGFETPWDKDPDLDRSLKRQAAAGEWRHTNRDVLAKIAAGLGQTVEQVEQTLAVMAIPPAPPAQVAPAAPPAPVVNYAEAFAHHQVYEAAASALTERAKEWKATVVDELREEHRRTGAVVTRRVPGGQIVGQQTGERRDVTDPAALHDHIETHYPHQIITPAAPTVKVDATMRGILATALAANLVDGKNDPKELAGYLVDALRGSCSEIAPAFLKPFLSGLDTRDGQPRDPDYPEPVEGEFGDDGEPVMRGKVVPGITVTPGGRFRDVAFRPDADAKKRAQVAAREQIDRLGLPVPPARPELPATPGAA